MMKTDHQPDGSDNVLNLLNYSARVSEQAEDVTSENSAFLQLTRELENMPYPIRSTEALLYASKLVEDAGYSLVKERQSDEVTHLFLIAAELEKRVSRILEG